MIRYSSVEFAEKIKSRALLMAHKANASHIGGAFSVADILAVLYTEILVYDATHPKATDRDRLFYSKGHACTTLYAALQLCGFITEAALDTFGQNGSYLTTHVNHNVPGIELSTGSLGHALSVACGVALAGKKRNASWQVFVIVSDGELDEGSNWEAILFAPHHRLDNLTVIVDYNKIQSFGAVSEVLSLEPLKDKFTSFGWHAVESDGHSHEELKKVLDKSNSVPGKPKVVIAHTVKGKGVDFMEHQLAWHYKSPDIQQLENALHQIQSSK